MSSILVIGSSNTDLVVQSGRFPKPGETLLGGDLLMFHGGKGANQAVAAARLGGTVSFICCVGDDLFGKNALAHYREEGLDLTGASVVNGRPSGVALILINDAGENEIVVAPGANHALTPGHLAGKKALLTKAGILLTQLETPIPVLMELAVHCRSTGQGLILNPAPARAISDDILSGLFLITPNQTEAEFFTGIPVTGPDSAMRAAGEFIQMGVRNVVVTMGSQGACFRNQEESFFIPAPVVEVKDTTAAGDVFNGALAVCLAEGKPWKEAVALAIRAASRSVAKMGAQSSAPYLHEIT